MIDDDGRIVQLTKLQEMAYGEMSGNPHDIPLYVTLPPGESDAKAIAADGQ